MLIYTRCDPRFFDRRLFKGGDGGAADLERQEKERQAKVQAAVDAINQTFGVGDDAAAAQRNAMYDDLKSATTDTALRDLDKQYTTASNKNKFGLARSGLLGGSVDAESGADLSTRYGEGRIQAEQAGIGAAADLRTQDEKTRQDLIGLAQSGIDTGTASSMAASQMAAAADAARSNAATTSVGDLFSNMSQAYLMQQQQAGRASVPTNAYSSSKIYTSSPNQGRTTNY